MPCVPCPLKAFSKHDAYLILKIVCCCIVKMYSQNLIIVFIHSDSCPACYGTILHSGKVFIRILRQKNSKTDCHENDFQCKIFKSLLYFNIQNFPGFTLSGHPTSHCALVFSFMIGCIILTHFSCSYIWWKQSADYKYDLHTAMVPAM